MNSRPRLLIEDWLPAAAIGVECMREEDNPVAKAPTKYLHAWFARRPLVASRAAILGSLLPSHFGRDVFERLLGFGRPAAELVAVRQMMDAGVKVSGGFDVSRAFKHSIREDDLAMATSEAEKLWGTDISLIDPMAGGGSIPLEGVRTGFKTWANEYNPVACSILEATVDYPIRFGSQLVDISRRWLKVWLDRVDSRLGAYYPKHPGATVHAYIYAHTIVCPDTQHLTPLIPDWHLMKPASGRRFVAVPTTNDSTGKWSIRIRETGTEAGQLSTIPSPTYKNGKGVSLFTGQQIPRDYIVAKAKAGGLGYTLYAIALKSPRGLSFIPPTQMDIDALASASSALARLRPGWERNGVIPTESIPVGDKTAEPIARGMSKWADLFTGRQLLAVGTIVEELELLRFDITSSEGADVANAVIHLFSFAIDKFLNYNSRLASWHAPRGVIRSVFDRHDFAFKASFAELAACGASPGLEWAANNVIKAYRELSELPRARSAHPAVVSLGSARTLPQISTGSITAIVVDPPYAGNVQYSELADFFYVWLKRTQGYRKPEWFSSYLSDHDEEAVLNISRHRVNENSGGKRRAGRSAKSVHEIANDHYQQLMTDILSECHRILRDDGVLTVMFTHKEQSAWESLRSVTLKGVAF